MDSIHRVFAAIGAGVLCTIALATCIVLTGGNAVAQSVIGPSADPVEVLSAQAKSFLQDVIAGQTDQAYQRLLQGSPLAEPSSAAKKKAVDTQIKKTQGLESLYGRARSFELVEPRRIGSDVVVLIYLYKCERFPVVWYFTFYRQPPANPGDARWAVVSVRFDTDVDQLAR